MSLRRVRFALPFFPLVACGGAPTPPPVAATAPAPVAAAQAAPAAPVADLGPVDAPADLVLAGRFTDAQGSLDRLSRWTKMPLSLSSMYKNDAILRVIDLSKPIDFAVAIDASKGSPDPVVAVGAAVRSLDEVKAVLSEKHDLVQDGLTLRIQKKKGAPVERKSPAPKDGQDEPGPDDRDDDDSDNSPDTCAVMPSFGSAAYRLVCAENDAAIRRLGAYMTRGVTRLETKSDVHVEAYAGPVRLLLTAVRGKAERSMKRELGAMPAVLELFHAYDPFDFALDMDRLTADISLGEQAADAQMTLSMREKASAITRMFTSHPERADVPPPAFMRLPIDSDVAFYTHGLDATDTEPFRKLAPEALSQMLTGPGFGMPQPDAMAFADVLRAMGEDSSSGMVYAHGIDEAKAKAAVDAYGKAKEADKDKAAQAAAAQLAGWQVIGLELPIAKVGADLKLLAAALGRQSFQTWAKKGESDPTPPPSFKLAATPAGLPRDALHYETTFFHREMVWTTDDEMSGVGRKSRKPTKPKAAPLEKATVHLLLVPDQGRTWTVNAVDLATAVAKAKGLAVGAPDDGTLAKRPGLDAVRSTRANMAGFMVPQAAGVGMPVAWSTSSAKRSVERFQSGGARKLTSGASVVPFSVTEQGGARGSVGAVTMSLHLPKDAVTEATSALGD